uniref:Uncharacterized protein n=1 Tax=Panagrellus redivivus TaxID=6233 RepID=A0A7E4V5I6_PANRE
MSKRRTTYNPYWRADTPSDEYPYVYVGDSDDVSSPRGSPVPEASGSVCVPPEAGTESDSECGSYHPTDGSSSSDDEGVDAPNPAPIEKSLDTFNDRFPPTPFTDADDYDSDDFDCSIDPDTIEDYDDRRMYIIERDQTLRYRAQEKDPQFEEMLRRKGEKALARDAARRQKLDEVRRIAAGRCTLPPPTKYQWTIPETSDVAAIQRAETVNDVFATWAEINQPDDLFEAPSSNRTYSKEENERTANEILAALDQRNAMDPPLDWEATRDSPMVAFMPEADDEGPVVMRYFELCGHLWQSEGPEHGEKVITHLRQATPDDMNAFEAKQDPLYSGTVEEFMHFSQQVCTEQYDLIEELGFHELEPLPVDEEAQSVWTISLLSGKHYHNEEPPPEELEKDRLLALEQEEQRNEEDSWHREVPMYDPAREEAEMKAQEEICAMLLGEISEDSTDDDGAYCTGDEKIVVKDDADIDADSSDKSISDCVSSDGNGDSTDIASTITADDTEAETTDAMEVDYPEPPVPCAIDIVEKSCETLSEVNTAVEMLSPTPSPTATPRTAREPSVASEHDEEPMEVQVSPTPPRKSPSVLANAESGITSPSVHTAIEAEPVVESTEAVPMQVEPVVIEPAHPPPVVAISLETAIPFEDIPNPPSSSGDEAPTTLAAPPPPPPVQRPPPPPVDRILLDFGPPLRCSDRRRRDNWREPLYTPTPPVASTRPKAVPRQRAESKKNVAKPAPPPAPKPAPKPTPKAAPKAAPKPKPKPKPVVPDSSDSSDNEKRRPPVVPDRTYRCKPAPLAETRVVPLRRSTRQRRSVDRYGASSRRR